jgi:hypothetical protein
VNDEFSIATDFDDQGGVTVTVSGTAVHLSRLDIALLYTQAESDWGTLSTNSLRELIGRRWHTALESPDALPASTQRLVEAGLLRQENVRGEADPAYVRQSKTGQRLITWLTRHWPGWPQYSRRFHFHHY